MPIATGTALLAAGLAGAGASAATGIYGAHKQSEATEEAGKISDRYNREALAAAREEQAYKRQQYAEYLNRMAPFTAAGRASTATLANLLARSPYTRTANYGSPSVGTYAQNLQRSMVPVPPAPNPLAMAMRRRPMVMPGSSSYQSDNRMPDLGEE